MHSGLTTASTSSVASRLQQSSLKAKLVAAENGASKPLLSPLNPIEVTIKTPAPVLSPRKRLNETERNTVRVIAQYLQDLGLNETVQCLVNETQIKVENSHAVRLRNAIAESNWDDAVAIIDSSREFLSNRQVKVIKRVLTEEKFFDLILKDKRALALTLLKRDFSRRDPAKKELTRVIFESHEEIFARKRYAKYKPDAKRGGDGKTPDVRRICKRLQRLLPPSFMLPANRLETLLEQAWERQVNSCQRHLHSKSVAYKDPSMLFIDHECQPQHEQYFVEKCCREEHKGEVWKVLFSPCGKYLASATYSTIIHFWKVNTRTRELDSYRKIKAREVASGVTGMSWSGDSRLLTVCGLDDHTSASNSRHSGTCNVYVYDMHNDTIYTQIPHHEPHSFQDVAMFKKRSSKGSYQLVIGDLKGNLIFYEISRGVYSLLCVYEGFRIRCVYACKSGRGVYAADTHDRIRWYRNVGKGGKRDDNTVIREKNFISNMTVHPSEQIILVTTKNLGLRLWSLQTRCLLRTFQGYYDGGYVINASFGGTNNEFICSGSYGNDSGEETIRIWRITDEFPICSLSGHRKTVNSVSWNPMDPYMIASGSDDYTVRSWSCKYTDLPGRLGFPKGDSDLDDEVIDEREINVKGDEITTDESSCTDYSSDESSDDSSSEESDSESDSTVDSSFSGSDGTLSSDGSGSDSPPFEDHFAPFHGESIPDRRDDESEDRVSREFFPRETTSSENDDDEDEEHEDVRDDDEDVARDLGSDEDDEEDSGDDAIPRANQAPPPRFM